MDHIVENIHWYWMAIGIVLIAAEALVPGAVLLWFGVAAVLTGLLCMVADPTFDYQVIFFSVVSVVSIVGFKWWRRGKPKPQPKAADGAALNRLGSDLVGRNFAVAAEIKNGSGRVKVGDTSWRCEGPDAPAGTQVRVLDVKSGTLVVELAD